MARPCEAPEIIVTVLPGNFKPETSRYLTRPVGAGMLKQNIRKTENREKLL